MQGSVRVALAFVVVLFTGLTACAGRGSTAPEPSLGRTGLHVTGTLGGQQLAVADGAPRLVVGDCQPRAGPSEDVCIISRTLVGELFVLAIANPDALASGMVLPVSAPACRAVTCDRITDVAVVDVQVGTGVRRRAVDGSLELRVVEPRQRYAGVLTLHLPQGDLTGEFDVVPRDR